MRRDVFHAIADPTRREIINIISNQTINLNAVAENFDISRPAISKHIKILTECGIVTITTQGREHYCETNMKKLNEVTDWIDHLRTFWTNKLDALGEYLEAPETEQTPEKSIKSKSKKI